MPLVEIWADSFTMEEKAKLQKVIAEALKEVKPQLKEHDELIWVIFNEVPTENWMIGPSTLKELKQKLTRK